MTNKVIENYILKEKIGSGQYGNVYAAEDQNTKQIVAVKVMHVQKFKMTPKLQEFTSNEISILKKMKSPHIIKFIEMLRTVNNYYLVYQYCNGGTLGDYLKRKKKLKETEALQIFSQIKDAFACLAAQNILHRDLKPANILFHDGVIKIADFGFCKQLMREVDMTQTMVGSPIYMAPEVLKGQTYNSKADIWSMGVILFELLFGYCPFQESTIAKLVTLIDNKPFRIPTDVPISQSTQTLLKKILVVDHTRRIGAQQLINYKLNIPLPDPAASLPDPNEQLMKYNRKNIEMISNIFTEFLETAQQTKLTVSILFMIGKIFYCYLKDLRRKSRYWHAVKSPQPLPDKWDIALEQQLQILQPIMDSLKTVLLQGSPELSLKIELETVYPTIQFLISLVQACNGGVEMKSKLLNVVIAYKHINNVLERNEVQLLGVDNDHSYASLQKKLQVCNQYVKMI